MDKITVAINGFGRIGRLVFRILMQRPNVEVVAINDLAEINMLAHLLKYDTAHHKYEGSIAVEGDHLVVDGKKIRTLAIKEPQALPWKELGIDLVLECTGLFRKAEQAALHLEAGAKKVLISAPAKGEGVKTVLLGVNEEQLNAEDKIVSNASCTTNCLAHMVKVLNDHFSIEKGFVTTVHAYTADQKLHDAPHKEDFRRARAAAMNIIPTTTNAGSALGVVIPEMKGKIHSTAMRVPVIDGSITELNAILKQDVTVEAINAAFKQEAEGRLKGIMEYTEEELVSSDIIGNPHSTIFDSKLTAVDGNFVKITAWYDNEFGYSTRLADVVEYLRKIS
ncbi:MAG: type I glyceraldehyde-3-phosphate dehydrogenase [Chitinophagales bacterium]|nr:type I glyceraldehyde-3-phosphate dehydrogenase [Chitinophagales bacterium]